jgi:hypothetical protein
MINGYKKILFCLKVKIKVIEHLHLEKQDIIKFNTFLKSLEVPDIRLLKKIISALLFKEEDVKV